MNRRKISTATKIYFVFVAVFYAFLAQAKTIEINVWVHGTNPGPEKIWMHASSPFRPWLYVEPGLNLALKLAENYYFNKLAHACAASNGSWNVDTFYTYGWPSTILSPKTRQIEGRKLFDQLNKLIDSLGSDYDNIAVRLVGFSHGGNVILNMISYLPFLRSDVELEIVFLGLPIQELTREYVNSLFLKRVYSFYSESDWMQSLDIQKLQNSDANVPWFSKKTFLESDQVIQVKLTVNGSSIGHRDYRSINHYLPRALKELSEVLPEDQKSAHLQFDLLT
ncbi:MAG: hypothetical protein NTU89_02285 [Candidatus Dependentiae bacterium]|nr:hypothetical protein [Candidatus Dependentiae bacterium]